MNKDLQAILNIIQQSEHLSVEEKNMISKSLKDANQELEITSFKLDRSEEVKRTTAILLEETIEELEQKSKAVEVQNKELEIETSLERVRTVAMGMRKAGDLLDICQILFAELHTLGFDELRNAMINIFDNDLISFLNYDYSDDAGKTITTHYYDSHPVIKKQIEEIRSSHNAFSETVFSGKDLDDWRSFRKEKGEKDDPKMDDVRELFYYFYSIGTGAIGISTYRSITAEKLNVLKRFRNVFDLAYRRFIDIEQAEAQAREAKIEAALERARTQSMLMQHSNELNDTLQVFHQQLQLFGIDSDFSFLWLPDEANDKHVFWATWAEEKNNSTILKSKALAYPLDRNEPYTAECLAVWKSGELVHTYKVPPAEVKNYFAAWEELLSGAEKLKAEFFPGGLDYVEAYMKYGCFGIVISRVLTEDEKKILRRFTVEFERAYTRFLDLQKAEAQTREAQIEAALERVRGRAMAMHKSDELLDAGELLYKELSKLGIISMTCGYVLMDDEEKIGWIYAANPADGTILPKPTGLPHSSNVMGSIKISWKKQEPFHVVELDPQATIEHHTYLAKNSIDFLFTLEEFLSISPERAVLHSFNFKQGYLLVVGGVRLTSAQEEMVVRFTKVFEMTYRRFLDLQQAEAQTREAVKQASVDRIRAEIASMRTTSDLERIQPLIWNELTTLCVPFTRCGVFIMDEEHEQVHTFLSTPEGKAIATLHVPFEFNLSIITNGVLYWGKKKIYKEHWDAAAFTKAWIKLSSLRENSIDSPQAEHPPESLYLQLLPFLQGMLYVGSDAPLNDEELQLVQNLADAFSTAYARYEDFNKLESAKAQIEKTLVDLKQAQAQLVQAEKMASLGELTAGIAHEIQNPLNFVNNFSEVNKELLAELNEEIEKGNYAEVKIIAKDVAGNEEKISHHGKRADAIVKGMLQHSRSSNATKEPTDINKLADEYLRLAYHGLRAKDKSFNTTLKTDYDETIGSIYIIPQDIGRVVLNLINNAFYTVNQKHVSTLRQAQGLAPKELKYDPTVSISTKKVGDTVEISVKDNGNGIPQKVVDKIFQPFFTTKPTGQGTGLGLSLAYDIVKAHGGELKLDTKDGESAEFIICLPI